MNGHLLEAVAADPITKGVRSFAQLLWRQPLDLVIENVVVHRPLVLFNQPRQDNLVACKGVVGVKARRPLAQQGADHHFVEVVGLLGRGDIGVGIQPNDPQVPTVTPTQIIKGAQSPPTIKTLSGCLVAKTPWTAVS